MTNKAGKQFILIVTRFNFDNGINRVENEKRKPNLYKL